LALSDRLRDVTPSGIRKIFDLSQGVPGLINLGIGEPDFEVPRFVREALKAAADSENRYTSNRGYLELRTQISKKLARENGVDADPDSEIIVTAGATQAVFVLMNAMLNEGDEVVIPTPAFSAYQAAVRLAGGRPVGVQLGENDGYRLNAKKLEKAFTRRTKLLVLNSPGNPTGVVQRKEDIEEVAASAVRNGIYLLSDEVYEKYLYGGARHFSPGSIREFRDKVVTVSGLSKTFAMTGWRLGFAVANERVIDGMTRYNMYNAVCASSVVQSAGIAALKGSLSFLKPVLQEYDRRRRTICGGLQEIGVDFVEPRGAFYIFPRIGGRGTDSNFFSRELLSRHKVATVPGPSFGRGGEAHIRISYAATEDDLRTAVGRIQKFRHELEREGRPGFAGSES
jgi:aminotransferase